MTLDEIDQALEALRPEFAKLLEVSITLPNYYLPLKVGKDFDLIVSVKNIGRYGFKDVWLEANPSEYVIPRFSPNFFTLTNYLSPGLTMNGIVVGCRAIASVERLFPLPEDEGVAVSASGVLFLEQPEALVTISVAGEADIHGVLGPVGPLLTPREDIRP